jgi:hypothetical protein
MRRDQQLRQCAAFQPTQSPVIDLRSPKEFCRRITMLKSVKHRCHLKHLHVLLPLFLLVSCLSLHAQQNSQIDGSVVDQAGSSVTGA